MANLVRNEVPEEIKGILDGKDYLVKGSPGIGNWNQLPWIGIFDPEITTSTQSGYYIIYLFKEDMQGVYLSINQGITDIQEEYDNKAISNLVEHAENFRKKIGNNTKVYDRLLKSISLGTGNDAPLYEAGNIYAKYYTLDDLPSEEVIISDLNEFLLLYHQLINHNQKNRIRKFIKNIIEIHQNDEVDEKTVYNILNDFSQYILNLTGKNGLYKSIPNADHNIPHIRLQREDKNLYILYILSEDKKGIHLSLNHRIFSMRDILSENGPKLNLKSKDDVEKFINGTKKRLDDLRIQYEKPEGFSSSMFLNAKNATSGKLYEACSIYSKYYDLENLPLEEELISDFKDILEIYKNSHAIGKINIKKQLEIIFKNLHLAKKRKEDVKGHQLGKAFTEISNAFFEIAKSIDPEKSYNSVAYYQSKGKWYFKPYVYIENKANKDIYGHWDQHYVGFWFSEDLEGVTLSLEQSINYAQNFLKNKLNSEYSEEEFQNYLKHHGTQIKNQLNKSLKITDKLLEESSKLTSNVDVFGKYYYKNNLPSNDEIISDFKELFNLYSELKPDKNLPSHDGLKIIDNKNEIELSQKKLESLLKIASDKSIEYSLESSNNNFYLSGFNIWTKSGKTRNFFVNMFGTGKPKNSNETIVEINFSYDGSKHLTSGAFAKDNSGNTFLLHNGKLGGKYVGKSLLEDNYKGKWVNIEESTIEKKFILIGGLDDTRFSREIEGLYF